MEQKVLREAQRLEEIAAQRPREEVALEITPENILDHLARSVFFDPRNIVDLDGNIKPIHLLDKTTATALVGVEVTRVPQTQRGPGSTTWKYKFPTRREALALLMQFKKMLAEGGGDVKALDELLEEYRRRYQRLANEADEDTKKNS